jgi:hypothetical protein
MKLTGENRSTRGKICPITTLTTTNPTSTDPESKPGLRGERPYRLSLLRYHQFPYKSYVTTYIVHRLHFTALRHIPWC